MKRIKQLMASGDSWEVARHNAYAQYRLLKLQNDALQSIREQEEATEMV
jgi:hypothetical protein